MRRFIKVIALILALVLLAVPVWAEGVETRASSFFFSSDVYLHKISSTQFEAWFTVVALDAMDELGASIIKIQRSADGETWTTMKTYTKAGYSQMICEDTGAHGACVTYTGTPGFYYRAKITLYAKNSTGVGEMTRYTAKIRL